MEVAQPQSADNIITMKNMVDLALGAPEVGAVNFNMLHTLLHAILSKLDMGQQNVDLTNKDNDGAGSGTKKPIPVTSTPYHQLQERIKIMENQISDLNSLPKTSDILAGFIPNKADDTKRTVSDLWQVLNMKRKVGANEEGIDRLSSLLDSLLNEVQQLKADNEKLKKQLEELSGLKVVSDKIKEIENNMANLKDELNKLRDRLNEYPDPSTLQNVVTWEGLENALNGVRTDVEELKKPVEKVVVNVGTEVIPPLERGASSGPSEAGAEMLERLGSLTDAHFQLEKRVEKLEKEMPNKADKKDLDGLKIPDDLLDLINKLKAQMEQLMASKNKDLEALARIRDIISGLQDRMKEIDQLLERLEKNDKDIFKQMAELIEITSDHENRKADKSYVDGLVRTKADKSLLDTKVNFTLFDETVHNLNNNLDDILKKLMAAEEELRNLMKALTSDLLLKADKDELNALRDWIEKRLRALAEKLKNMKGFDITDDEAAGLRKQLLQHFHCISCDRPVDMMPQMFNTGDRLPDPKGLPPNKSLRPYTTYEMDTLRQQAKISKNIYVQNHTKRYGADIVDVYQTPRPCGGSHTTTYSHKRMVRMGNMNNSFVEEDPHPVPKIAKDELDLQGTDGHIYRGRMERNQTTLGTYNVNNATRTDVGFANQNSNQSDSNSDKLPPVNLGQTKSSTTMAKSGYVTRPKSAVRISPRPQSGGLQNVARPMSAKLSKDEPASRPTTPTRTYNQAETVVSGLDAQPNTEIISESIIIEPTEPFATVNESENLVLEMINSGNQPEPNNDRNSNGNNTSSNNNNNNSNNNINEESGIIIL